MPNQPLRADWGDRRLRGGWGDRRLRGGWGDRRLRGGGAVAVLLLHLLIIAALLLSDRLRPVGKMTAPSLLLTLTSPRLPVPGLPPASFHPLTIGPARPLTLATPTFAIHGRDLPVPVTPSPLLPRGLDLSRPQKEPITVEKMFPTQAERLKRQALDQARDDAIDNDKAPPSSDDDCDVVVPQAGDPTPPQGGFSIGEIPVTVCRPHMTLRALQRRNDRLTPH